MRNYIFILKLVFCLCAVAVLASCGGGSKNNNSSGSGSSSGGINIAPNVVRMEVGNTVELKASVNKSYNRIIWYSENQNIAVVSAPSGDQINVTAKRDGVTYIVAYLVDDSNVRLRIPIYVGDLGPIQYVLIYNVSNDINRTLSAGSTPLPPTSSEMMMSTGITEKIPEGTKGIIELNGRRVYQKEPSLYLPQLTEKQHADIAMSQTQYATSRAIGESRLFYTNYGGIESTLTAQLIYSGGYCDVWVAVETGGSKRIVPDKVAEEIGKEFDAKCPVMAGSFGDYKKNPGGKIVILLEDIYDASSGTYTLGYFSPNDLLIGEKRNNLSMIHIDTDPTMKIGENLYDASKAFPTLVHEFQHLINYTDNPNNELWWNEAFSSAAEFMFYGDASRIDDYNRNDGDIISRGAVLTYRTYMDNQEYLSANYGLPFLFGQYIRMQVGGNAAIYKNVLESSQSGSGAIMDGLAKMGYVDATTFSELHRNFKVALVLNRDSGPYGFTKDYPAFYLINKHLNIYNNILLKGSSSVVQRAYDMFERPTSADKDILFHFF